MLTFIILNNDLSVKMPCLFDLSGTNHIRDHRKKVKKPRSNKRRVEFRFSYRMVDDWNVLTERVV